MTSLIKITNMKEMQIKTTINLHLMLVRMAIIKKTSVGQDVEKESLVHRWWEYKLVQPL